MSEKKEEKVGGYGADLTPRSRAYRQYLERYYEASISRDEEVHPEHKLIVELILSKINATKLQGVFIDALKQCFVPQENISVDGLVNVLTAPMQESDAKYDAFLNRIVISTNSATFTHARQLLAEGKEFPEELMLDFELRLIHEYCHSFSRNRITTQDMNNQRSLWKTETGYERGEDLTIKSMRPEKRGRGRQISTLLEAFNEGVTQRITEEIFLQYGKSVGKAEVYKKHLAKRIREHKEGLWRYYVYGNQVDFICTKIAAYTGESKDDVWRKVKKGYFNSPEDIIDLIKESLGVSFFEQYSKIGNGTPLKDIFYFDGNNNIPFADEYIDAWEMGLGLRDTS